MNKQQIQQRVLQRGNPLDLHKFEWNNKNKVFSSKEDNLVLDFEGIDRITFILDRSCNVTAGHNCTLRTGSYCIAKVGDYCVIVGRHESIIKAGEKSACITYYPSQAFEIPANTKIKLNSLGVKGYTVVSK